MARYSLASTTWDSAEIDAMQRVIDSGMFTMGQNVRKFEEEFASHFGKKYAVMSNSGSSANLLAMAAVHYSSRSPFQRGRTEVIVPAVSWSTTYYPIHQLGYTLKFVDIDPGTLNLDIEQVAEAISDQTAGIFAVNLLGNPSELVELRSLADRHGLFLLEDNCESMGAVLNGIYAGAHGDIGTFSSFFSHHISTMEGGLCITDDLEYAQIMTSMRAHGWTRELPQKNFVHDKSGDPFDDLFRFVLPGYNLRPLELSGAIGIEQMKKLPSLIAARKLNAAAFQAEFSDIPGISLQRENGESSWFGFSLILSGEASGRRSELVEALSLNEIDSRPIVAGNFTRNPVLKHLRHTPFTTFPNADLIHDHGLFLGNHHYDISTEITRAAQVARSVLEE